MVERTKLLDSAKIEVNSVWLRMNSIEFIPKVS